MKANVIFLLTALGLGGCSGVMYQASEHAKVGDIEGCIDILQAEGYSRSDARYECKKAEQAWEGYRADERDAHNRAVWHGLY